MNKTILIIEDNEKHRFILEGILDDAGYKVESVKNGREVKKKMKGTPQFDMILVDIAVPGFDAIGFIKEYSLKYKILVVSAYADDEYVREALPDSKRRLKKPFDTVELRRRVDEILSD